MNNRLYTAPVRCEEKAVPLALPSLRCIRPQTDQVPTIRIFSGLTRHISFPAIQFLLERLQRTMILRYRLRRNVLVGGSDWRQRRNQCSRIGSRVHVGEHRNRKY